MFGPMLNILLLIFPKLFIFRDKNPKHQGTHILKDKDSFIHYIFKVVQEKLKSIDKRLSEQGHSGMEGADVILGHLKSMAQVLINYAGIY